MLTWIGLFLLVIAVHTATSLFDTPLRNEASIIVALPQGGAGDEHTSSRILRRLSWHAGMKWTERTEIHVVKMPNFKGPPSEAVRYRLEWAMALQKWMDRSDGVILFPSPGADKRRSSLLRFLQTQFKDPLRTCFPASEDEHDDEMKHLLRKARLAVRYVVTGNLDEWNFPKSKDSWSQLSEWEDQFKGADEVLARDILLRSFNLLRPPFLGNALDLPHCASAYPEAPFFLLGGTSDAQIHTVNRQTQSNLIHFPEDGDLWKDGNSDALILTDWSESGRQLGNKIKLSLTHLAKNSERRLNIRAAWVTRLALKRIQWLAEKNDIVFGADGQLNLYFPSDSILENLPADADPDFEGEKEMNIVIPEWLVVARQLLGKYDIQRCCDGMGRLMEGHFSSLLANGDKGRLGICTAWTFSAGEHNHPLLVRVGEKIPSRRRRWMPLLHDALRDRSKHIEV